MVGRHGTSCRGYRRRPPFGRFRVAPPSDCATGCRLPAVGFVRGFLAPFRGGAFVLRHRLWHYLVLPIMLDVALAVSRRVPGRALLARRRRSSVSSCIKAPAVGWLILVVLTVRRRRWCFSWWPSRSCSPCSPIGCPSGSSASVRGTAPTAPFLASTGRALVARPAQARPLRAGARGWRSALTADDRASVPGRRGARRSLPRVRRVRLPALPSRARASARSGPTSCGTPRRRSAYGLGATLLYLIPFAIFVAPPFAAVGATLVFVEAERTVARRKPEVASRRQAG